MHAVRITAQLCALLCCLGACSNSVDGPEAPGERDATQNAPDDTSPPPASNDDDEAPSDPEEPIDEEPGPTTGYPRRTKNNLLFSGHSLIDNPIPDFAVAIAEARGDTVDWEQQNIPGSTIRARTEGQSASDWNGYRQGKNRDGSDMNLEREIASPAQLASGERYDTLVITERHGPLDTIEWERTFTALYDYHRVMTNASSTARTLFYQCWPNMNINDPTPWIENAEQELHIWECTASKLNHALVAEGKAPAITVVPMSIVIARVLRAALAGEIPGVTGSQMQRLRAIISDDVHTTRLGAYALGAGVYAAAYGASPVGALASDEFSDDAMRAVEQIAWEVISTYPAAERSMRDLSECRTAIANQSCPAYNEIWGRDWRCSYWGEEDGHFSWPDTSFTTR